MSAQYSHTSKVDIGDNEVEVEFEYNLSPLIPEQGPTYASGGQPAEGGELEILSATILIPASGRHHAERHKAPDWMLTLFNNDDYIGDELREAAE